jgi:glutathione peroxidase
MAEKIDVKGKNQHPLYQWLTQKEKNGVENSTVSWNFNKFLIGADGTYLGHFQSGTKPMSKEITDLISK